MSQIYDLRKYNIKNEEDLVAFLELVQERVPQILKVVKSHKLEKQSLLNRAEYAENALKNNNGVRVVVGSTPSDTVSERMSGKVATAVPEEEQRLNQLRQAVTEPTATVVDPNIAADPLGLSPAGNAIVEDTTPATPGNIGQAPVDPRMQVKTDEEIAAEAGTPSSEHSTNDGVQSQDTEATPPVTAYKFQDGDEVFNQFQYGEIVYQQVNSGNETHYLEDGLHISVQDFHEAQSKVEGRPATAPAEQSTLPSAADTTPIANRVISANAAANDTPQE